MAAPSRRNDHRRPVIDPHTIGDTFASGVDVQDHEDWTRLNWWVDVAGNGNGTRRKVASIVLPRSALPTVMQELRGSQAQGHGRETRRH
ncbi:hypothetical protein AAFX91_21745 [Bradyrhizobium sp. 31Argb]|uniref:hypothetical protein n=1 Tax=Bradyrhizobium sp. 31Argb TaxID=3141247 RepID=UPI0037483456